MSRNHHGRLGHVALGVFPAFVIREVLLRRTPLTRGGLTFIIVSIVLAVAAFWELLEWCVTLLVASDMGQAYLSSRGDVRDAHGDMLPALIGAMAVPPLPSGAHDRSIGRLPAPVRVFKQE